MSAARSNTRERMLASTVQSLREHGASGTSVDEVLRRSGAPRGSVYHHFPGGRAQIVEEAVELSGAGIEALIAGDGTADSLTTFDSFLAVWRLNLIQSGFTAGCPVLAVAIEANDDAPQLTEAAGRAFGSWQAGLRHLLRRDGVSPAHARRLATLIVASIEGAVALSRVERSIQPLDDVGRELRGLLLEATS